MPFYNSLVERWMRINNSENNDGKLRAKGEQVPLAIIPNWWLIHYFISFFLLGYWWCDVFVCISLSLFLQQIFLLLVFFVDCVWFVLLCLGCNLSILTSLWFEWSALVCIFLCLLKIYFCTCHCIDVIFMLSLLFTKKHYPVVQRMHQRSLALGTEDRRESTRPKDKQYTRLQHQVTQNRPQG